MNNPKNSTAKRALPFFIEFVKFTSGFVAILALALFTLHMANAAR